MKFILFCTFLFIFIEFPRFYAEVEPFETRDSTVVAHPVKRDSNNYSCAASNITCTHGEHKVPNPNGTAAVECICSCDTSKYTGNFCQFDLDACSNAPCQVGSTCLAIGVSNYTCLCPNGMQGKSCEKSILNPVSSNPCAVQNRCLNGGTCKAISGTESTCACDEFNFHGEYCQFSNGCSVFPCQNGGICSANGNDFTCQCTPGFTDPTCFTRDPCLTDSIECLNGGTCERLSNKHGKCNCAEGWLGERCDIPKPCQAQNPCLHSGICNVTADGYDFVCTCGRGYYGKICEFRDPCVMENMTCHGRGICERLTDTEAVCKCISEDFYGKNCETKRETNNLCSTAYAGKCLNNGRCIADSLALGVKCACPKAYSGTNCEVFDPCHLPMNLCQNGGTCNKATNSTSTTCTCHSGFDGTNCELYSACASSPCVHAIGCEDVRTDYYCKCKKGWQGRQCTLSTGTTKPETGTSNNFVDNYCKTKFSGKCANGATCISFGDKEYECACTPEFTGKDCTQSTNPGSNMIPFLDPVGYLSLGQNQGRSVRRTEELYKSSFERAALQLSPRKNAGAVLAGPRYPVGRGRALTAPASPPSPPGPCQPGMACDLCLTQYAGICKNGGVCITQTATATFYECDCDDLHGGQDCSVLVPKTACTDNPCEHGGICVLHDDGSFHCDCRVEYLGQFCRERDPCKFGGDNDCLNGGTCVRANDIEYECECRVPFVGDQCEEEDLCTIDPGECVDDLIPTQKCFPCGITESCKKISASEYSCDAKIKLPGRVSSPDDFVFVYPKTARRNQEVTFKMRFPKTTAHLNWKFDDLPVKYIDVSNYCGTLVVTITDPAFVTPFLFCSFTQRFPMLKTYAFKVESTGFPSPTETGSIRIYDNCMPSVRIHNIGHVDDYKSVEMDPVVEPHPMPEFRLGTTSRAVVWATVYLDCEPENSPVQICSVDFQWRLDDEGKSVPDGRENNFIIHPDRIIPKYSTHELFVTANVNFIEGAGSLDCTVKALAHLHVTAVVKDQGTFMMGYSNPVAIIEGGSARVLYRGGTITLNGTKSYDPEDQTGVSPLTFTWTCVTHTPPTGVAGPCGTTIGYLAPAPIHPFPPNTVPLGKYKFMLEVVSGIPGGSHGTATQEIEVVDSAVLDYSIACIRNCKDGQVDTTNRENKVVLKCQCTKCNVVLGQWDLKVQFSDPLGSRPPVDCVPLVFCLIEKSIIDPSIGGSQVFIQIDPNPPAVLAAFAAAGNPNPQLTLTFTCSKKGDMGKAQLQLAPSSNLPKPKSSAVTPPCKILPNSATPTYAFKDKFKILCVEFVTANPPLTFTFYAKIRAERGRGKLHEYEYEYGYPIMHEFTTLLSDNQEYKDIFKYYEFVLPAGHPHDGYRLPMTVKVSDSLGQSSYYALSPSPVVKPMIRAEAVLQDWYLGERSRWTRLVQAKNYASILQHALAYFHYASVVDPLTISLREKDALTSLKTAHIYELVQMGKISIHQVEHITSIAFAAIHGDYDKEDHSLSDGALILAARLTESLGKELRSLLRSNIINGGISTKSDSYDSPMVDAIIKAGVTSVHGIIDPLNILHHEFILHSEFSEAIPEYPTIFINLKTVDEDSPRCLEALQYFADCFGSQISITQDPVVYPPKGYFGIFVQIIHETEFAGIRAPLLDTRLPKLLQQNYVQLSARSKVTPSAGNQLKFIQIMAIVSMFNPFLTEKVPSEDVKRGMNIETPIFVFEVKDDFDTSKLSSIPDDSSFPHVFQLSYFNVDRTATSIKTHETGMMNIDIFSVPDVDRHAYLLSLPSNSIFFVAVDVFGVRNIDLHIVITKDRRPSCQDLYEQSSSTALTTFGDRIGGVAYSLTTSFVDERSSSSDEQHLGNPDCKECSDYYIMMWPTADTHIPLSLNKKPEDSLDVHRGFSELRCFTKPEISGSVWALDCTTGMSLESTAGLTCSCQHLSIIGSSQVPVQSINQDFIKFDLFSELNDNMLVPYVVISFLIFYIIVLAIVIYIDIANYKRPKLIIFGDIKRIRVETVYLLTVETGNDWFGGTTAKVLCQVFGDKGQTKQMVLSNYILDTMRENDEQSFLISCPEPLGNLKSIQLSHDNSGPTPSWFCRRVIIRDVKTDQTWFFFVERWISTWKGKASLACSVPLATTAEVQEHFANKFTLKGYWRQVREHHLWISPVTCPARSDFKRCERLTCWMASVCSYMLFNLILYRIPKQKYDGGIIHFESVHFNQYDPIFAIGTKGSLCGIWVGIIVTEVFRLLRRKMVPALIVFDGATLGHQAADDNGKQANVEGVIKPDSEKVGVVQQIKSMLTLRREKLVTIPTPQPRPASIQSLSRDVVPNEAVAAASPLPSRRRRSASKEPVTGTCFRVPSTDIINTEKWIAEMEVDEESLVTNLAETLQYDSAFVRQYQHPKRGKCDCSTQVNKVFQYRPKKPNSHRTSPTARYMPGDCADSTNHLKTLQSRCISRISIRKVPYSVRLLSSLTEDLADPVRKHNLCPKCDCEKVRLPRVNNRVTEKPKSVLWEARQPSPVKSAVTCKSRATCLNLAPADLNANPGSDEPLEGRMLLAEETVNYELGSLLYSYQRSHFLPYRPFIYLAWALCFSIIIIFSGVNIYFGARFGWVKSCEWCLSMCYTFLESFFVMQPLKVLIIYIIIVCCARRHGVNTDQIIVKTRFKLIWMEGLTEPMKIWPLNYLIHPIRIDELSGLPQDYVITKSGFHSTGRRHRHKGRRNFRNKKRRTSKKRFGNSQSSEEDRSPRSSEGETSDRSDSSQERENISHISKPNSNSNRKPPRAKSPDNADIKPPTT